jgi:hypothetical protein
MKLNSNLPRPGESRRNGLLFTVVSNEKPSSSNTSLWKRSECSAQTPGGLRARPSNSGHTAILTRVTKRLSNGNAESPAIRVPVTPVNRDYLKQLRRAELEAWENAGPESKPAGGNPTGLACLAELAQDRRTESLVYLGLTAVSLTALAIGLVNAFRFLNGLSPFTQWVQAIFN